MTTKSFTDLIAEMDGKLSLEGNGSVVSDIELQDYSETLVTVSASGGVLTLDYSEGNTFVVTLSASVTSIDVVNLPAGGKTGSFSLMVIQDPASPRTVDFSGMKWNNGTPPTVTATIGAVDFFSFTTIDAGANIYGFVAGQAMA